MRSGIIVVGLVMIAQERKKERTNEKSQMEM